MSGRSRIADFPCGRGASADRSCSKAISKRTEGAIWKPAAFGCSPPITPREISPSTWSSRSGAPRGPLRPTRRWPRATGEGPRHRHVERGGDRGAREPDAPQPPAHPLLVSGRPSKRSAGRELRKSTKATGRGQKKQKQPPAGRWSGSRGSIPSFPTCRGVAPPKRPSDSEAERRSRTPPRTRRQLGGTRFPEVVSPFGSGGRAAAAVEKHGL
jgi:hypothetical protein